MPHKVHYMNLANWLQVVPLSATCGDLMGRLETFKANDADYWASILAEMGRLPRDAEMMVGLFKVCELLKADNVRFDAGMMLDWMLEER